MFYNYIYVDPTTPGKFTYPGCSCSFLFEPIYVGKGSKNRKYSHLSHYHLYKSTVNPIKQNKLRKLVIEFNMRDFIITIPATNECECLITEQTLISNIGRVDLSTGPLTNCDEGGTGSCGRVDSVDTINKRRQSLESTYNKRRGSTYEALYGEQRALDMKRTLSKNNTGRQLPTEWKNNISNSKKGRKNPKTKSYKAKSPLNETFTILDGLRSFCIEHRLAFNVVWNNLDNGAIVFSPKNKHKSSQYDNTIGWSFERLK